MWYAEAKRYLIGKRQEIIIITENLHGKRIVLYEGVARCFDSVMDHHVRTLVIILRRVMAKLRSHKSGCNVRIVSD